MHKLILLCLLITLPSFAYEPTNFTGSKEEVRGLFDGLWSKFKSFDNYHCYRRAHILSYQLKQEKNINTMKVFFFKGDKLELPMNWYYHVAPMIYFQDEAVVLDRGLFEGATYLSDWLMAFSEGQACKEVQSMDEYRQFKPIEKCLYMIVPMYYYTPSDLEQLSMDSFLKTDLMDMLFALPRRMRQKYRYIYPID